MVPYWPKQALFSVLFKMLIDIPILSTPWKNLLKLPQDPELVNSMWKKIDIVVCHLAVSSQKVMGFQRKLKIYWKHHGNCQQGKDMLGMYSDSHSIAINGMLIPFRQPPTAAHIPVRHQNINADRESKELSNDLERMLCPKSLHKALKILKFSLKADMFASNINYQFYTYFSYKTHPKAKAMDSFTFSWHFLKFYAFSSFTVISTTSRKSKQRKLKVY